tara:strand:+ start:375 stop:650 length:276 start_codon:yes stop_codon:yes gene_type:complete
MKTSITLNTQDNIAKYLCIWNDGEIVQIHTEKTLREDYKDSNLFDCEEANETLFDDGDEYMTLEDYLDTSKSDKYVDINFRAENMEIKRII